MKIIPKWESENIFRGHDKTSIIYPTNGTEIWQFTNKPVTSDNIYCEQIYASVDGNRIAFVRLYPEQNTPNEVWVCDLFHKIVAKVGNISKENRLSATTPFIDSIYYVGIDKNYKNVLTRFNLSNFEKDEIFAFNDCPLPCPLPHSGIAISPDEKYFVGGLRIKEDIFGLYRIDLKKQTWEVFHEHPDIFNSHVQYEPSEGNHILVQLNRGGKIDEDGNVLIGVGDNGATLYVIDKDGKNCTYLPVGTPDTEPVSGHECWIGKTKRVMLSAGEGKMYTVGIDDKKAEVLTTGFWFNHISVSMDARFFVMDTWPQGRIYVGSFRTKKFLPFCESYASCGNSDTTHTHPYMTPDNKHIIFNSDRTGIQQVYAALIPDGFLASLES